MTSVHLNFPVFVLWPRIWFILVKVRQVLGKKLCILFCSMQCFINICQVFQLIVFFGSVSLLIFCLLVFQLLKSEAVKFNCGFASFSLQNSFCFIFLKLLFSTFTLRITMSFWWIDPLIIMQCSSLYLIIFFVLKSSYLILIQPLPFLTNVGTIYFSFPFIKIHSSYNMSEVSFF